MPDFRPPAPLSVLIADDSKIVRDNLKALLLTLPLVSVSGETGSVAATISAVAQQRPDVVVLDLNMPGGSGLDALRAIKAATPAPTVIILTMHPYKDLGARCLEAGADYYFEKSAELDGLLGVLEGLCRHRFPGHASPPAFVERRKSPAQTAPAIVAETWQQFRTSKALFRHLMDSDRDCLKLLDLSGRLLWMSDGGQRAMEIDGHETNLSNIWADLWQGTGRNAAMDALAQARAGRAGTFTSDCRTAKGRLKWWEVTVTPLPDSSGRPEKLLAISRDITGLKQTESHLRESEARLRAIIDHEPECVKVVSTDGQLLEMNPAGLAMIEAGSLAEAQQKPLLEYVLPEYRATFEALHRSVLAGDSGKVEFEVLGLRGTRRWLVTHGTPLRDAEGAVQSLLGVTRDITERKRADSRIREQADLINKARDAIIVTDLDGRITMWNSGAERMSGWSSAEALGRTADEIFGPGNSAQLQAARAGLEAAGEWRGEFQLQSKDGVHHVMEFSITLVRDDAGRPKARLSLGTDVTEQKKIEEQFLRVQRLESIGMLAAGIAHDLNNVLSPILMAAPMLRQRATDPTDLRMLESLEQSAQRGAGLVRQILSFAQGTGGSPQLLQVKHLATDIMEMVRETFPKTITLEHDFPKETWPIHANPTHIHQVLLNLCVNARDAMPQGGTLSVSAVNCVLDAAQAAGIPDASAGSFLVLTVGDTGSGIPPDVLARMWEPFFTTKAEGKGTGLGLSTVRGLVENHYGFVTVDTAADRGTTIRIYLPATVVGTRGRPLSETHPPFLPRGNGELLLLVDDEASNRETAHTALARHGYRVLVAANGKEAVELAVPRLHEISLIITDLHMPGLDGVALCDALRRIKPGVKVIVTSGDNIDSGMGDLPENLKASYLAKPFRPDALLHKVHELLRSDNAKRS